MPSRLAISLFGLPTEGKMSSRNSSPGWVGHLTVSWLQIRSSWVSLCEASGIMVQCGRDNNLCWRSAKPVACPFITGGCDVTGVFEWRAEIASVPLTPAELATDAVAALNAGASELHIHPCDGLGIESLEDARIGSTVSAICAAVPGMPAGVSTGVWIAPGGAARLEAIRSWTVLPDYASVNLEEDDAPECIEILLSKGIGVEAGLATKRDAERFITLPEWKKALRILVELDGDELTPAWQDYRDIIDVLEAAGNHLPILLHANGPIAWEFVREAAIKDYSTRIGFEDCLILPDGRHASTNAELVAKAAEIMGFGRGVLTSG